MKKLYSLNADHIGLLKIDIIFEMFKRSSEEWSLTVLLPLSYKAQRLTLFENTKEESSLRVENGEYWHEDICYYVK